MRYQVSQLDEIPPVTCPCGQARRAFTGPDNQAASVHLVTVTDKAQTHYHRQMTEIYVVLEGEGHVELDGDLIPVKPMSAVYLPPGCRHRALGPLKILNIPIPAFDPADEWFDGDPQPTEASLPIP